MHHYMHHNIHLIHDNIHHIYYINLHIPMFFIQGSNAVIEYSVVGGDGKFRVDASGNIISNSTFDYERKMRYEFQVCHTVGG